MAFVCPFILAAAAFGATPAEFYVNLLQRGISHFGASQYDLAARALRIAAFGFVDSVPQFQTAQVYLAVASKRGGRDNDARTAASRVVAAERIERNYQKLTLPDTVRTSFEEIAAAALSRDQVAFLRGGPAPQEAPTSGPRTTVTSTPTSAPRSDAIPPRPAPVPVDPPSSATTNPAERVPAPTAPSGPAPQPTPTASPTPATQQPLPAPRSSATMPPPQPAPRVEPVPSPTPAATAAAPTPATPSAPASQPPATPVPVQPKTAPVPTAPTSPPPQPQPSPQPTERPEPPRTASPAPQPVPAATPTPATDLPAAVIARLRESEAMLQSGDRTGAARLLQSLADDQTLDRASLVRIGAALARAGDFRSAIRVFARVATFAKGEEQFRFYYAVSLYETGRYRDAKRELAAAVPGLEETREVTSYRMKIEGAIE